ncbi:MAG: ferrous iron transport protein B [Kiritimatiellia bacterium]
MGRIIKAALAGNPNSGKTTIFNNLTGARHHVANYPGVTVSTEEGDFTFGDTEFVLTDLPGTYSLAAYSPEERIARDFIIREKPDVVLNVVDATNIERNLYLTTQLMELGVPLVLVFNMSDMAQEHGAAIDIARLSTLLRVPVVETVGHKRRGMDEICRAAIDVVEGRREGCGVPLHYGHDIDPAIASVESEIEADKTFVPEVSARWMAVKLLENDACVREKITRTPVLELADRQRAHLAQLLGDRPETVIASRRYGFISGACTESLLPASVEARHIQSDKIDAVLTHPFWGLPIFLALMYVVFAFTFTLGDYPTGWLESFFGWAGGVIGGFWPEGSDSLLRSLLVDGIIGGVGGVISFLPNILLLFLAIAFLEDSGYMSRAAFIMDHLMHKIGLHGQSFIPMLIGFGCSVPAILATRTLDSRRDRITTIMIIPLMSCGARLTVYALIIPAFFPVHWQGPVLWLIYFTGILLAVGSAWILRHTLLKGESVPMVMELPPYRIPTLLSVAVHTWERSWEYLKKAGTVILSISIVLWAMTAFPRKPGEAGAFAAEEAAAQDLYNQGIRDLAHHMSLPADFDLGALLQDLPDDEFAIQDPGLAHFVSMLKQKRAIERRYAHHPVRGELHDDPVLLEKELLLTRLRSADPATCRLVAQYEEKVFGPREQALRKIERRRHAEGLSYSMIGRLGHALDPVWRPMGFDWRIGTALIGAFAAKEVFVAQMGIIFASGGADGNADALRGQLRAAYSPLVGLCILLFTLISSPCLATVAATRKETESWGWAVFQMTWLTVLAYAVTVAVFQIGRLLGWGI